MLEKSKFAEDLIKGARIRREQIRAEIEAIKAGELLADVGDDVRKRRLEQLKRADRSVSTVLRNAGAPESLN